MQVGPESGLLELVAAQGARLAHEAIRLVMRQQHDPGVFIRHRGGLDLNDDRQVHLVEGVAMELDLVVVEAAREAVALVVATRGELAGLGRHGLEGRVPDLDPIRNADQLDGRDALGLHLVLDRRGPLEPDVAVRREGSRHERELVDLVDEDARIDDRHARRQRVEGRQRHCRLGLRRQPKAALPVIVEGGVRAGEAREDEAK